MLQLLSEKAYVDTVLPFAAVVMTGTTFIKTCISVVDRYEMGIVSGLICLN